MRLWLATLMVFACGSTTAWADARADCENVNLPADPRITACSAIIRDDAKAGWAYLSRGVAYRAKGDVVRATADYNEAIEMDPRSAAPYIGRGNVYLDKMDYNRAIADYTKAVEFEPKNSGYARSLGVAKYITGDLKGAATDLLHALELKDDVYAMLFRFLARSRAGETATDELEANAGRLKTKEWPYTVTELYLGKRSSAATLDAAIKSNDRCEAQFYVGAWQILKGNAAEGATALKVAVDTCPKTYFEYHSAIAELKRLKP